MARAVSAIMGRCVLVASSCCRIALAAANPSITGICTSINTKSLREFGGRLGTKLDQHFAPLEIGLDQDMAEELRRDWERLLERIGNRRGRDLSALSPNGEAVE